MIENYLKELLFSNDIVALPGLGCFLTERKPAQISIANNKILPPSKTITFNEKLHVGDGHNFIKTISEAENITETEAQNRLFSYAGQVKYILNTEKQYIIEEVGRLYTNKDGSLAFEQFHKFNYLEDSYGLPDIYLQSIVRNEQIKVDVLTSNVEIMSEVIDQNSEEDELEFEDSNQPKKSSGLGLYYFASAFALVFVLCTTYYLNMDKNTYAIGSFDPISFLKGGNSEAFSDQNADISENKLLPDNSDNEFVDNQPVSNDSETQVSSEASVAVETKNAEPAAQPMTVTESIDLSQAVTSKMGKFYIVVGSFKKSSKAQAFITDLQTKGLDAKMIAQDGNTDMLRVSAADFDDYNQANTKKSELQSQFGLDSWILNY